MERFISLLLGQQVSRLLTAQPWVTAAGTRPVATLFFWRRLHLFALGCHHAKWKEKG